MINAILVFNNSGKPRLTKFYLHFTTEEQKEILNEIYQIVSKREDGCNFLDWPSSSKTSTLPTNNKLDNNKVVFRHYATLFFVFIVDECESELGILDLIQVFVEALDKTFANVCELDLIFNSDQCLMLVNEIVQSGMVLETNINNIIAKYEEQNRIAKLETNPAASSMAKASSAISSLKNLQQLKDLPNTFKDLKF